MKVARRCFLAFIFFAMAYGTALQGFGQAQKESKEAFADPAKAFRAVEGFQSLLSLKTKAGKTAKLNVGLRRWSIDGALGRQNIRVPDFTLFHVRGGKIRVFSGGKEDIKTTDMYWTLPADSTLTLQVKGETALLDVMTISPK
jgi:hypothetical protein